MLIQSIKMYMYNITRGQLITLWVFGIIAWLVSLVISIDSYGVAGFAIALLIIIPAGLTFYTVGWKSKNKTKKATKEELRSNPDGSGTQTKSFCSYCGKKIKLDSSFCQSCGEKIYA